MSEKLLYIHKNRQFNHKKFYLAYLIQGLKVEKTIFCRKLQSGLLTKRFSAPLGNLCSFVLSKHTRLNFMLLNKRQTSFANHNRNNFFM